MMVNNSDKKYKVIVDDDEQGKKKSGKALNKVKGAHFTCIHFVKI